MRERRPRSAAESSAGLRREAMSCIYTIQDTEAKQEPKHNANMPWTRFHIKTTMESDVLTAQENRLRNRCPRRVCVRILAESPGYDARGYNPARQGGDFLQLL